MVLVTDLDAARPSLWTGRHLRTTIGIGALAFVPTVRHGAFVTLPERIVPKFVSVVHVVRLVDVCIRQSSSLSPSTLSWTLLPENLSSTEPSAAWTESVDPATQPSSTTAVRNPI